MNRYPMVLVHEGKHCNNYVVATNKEEEDLAWLAMFRLLDKYEHYYDDYMEPDEQELYEQAKRGNAKSARWLLETRTDYEYERVSVELAHSPKEFLASLESDDESS